MKRDSLYYQEILNSLGQRALPNFYSDVLSLRKASLCMLCDWHNQNYINVESLTVTYKNDFCMSLIENHLEVLYDKYNTLFYVLLVLDEWVYMTSDERLFESSNDRAIFRRYALILDKCKSE